MRSSGTSGAIFAVLLLGGVVAVVLIGELPRLLEKNAEHAPNPAPTSPATAAESPPTATPTPAALPGPAAPPARDLAAQLNAELPALGLPKTARIVEARVEGERLTLIFDGALRESLGDVSALDGWIEALSQRAAKLGHSKLGLRLRTVDNNGISRDVTIDSLVATPAAERPRPEPIDDGVRR